ncbi:MAG: T9SS type A sorting domain-containing protein [Bacteroidota bacterium]
MIKRIFILQITTLLLCSFGLVDGLRAQEWTKIIDLGGLEEAYEVFETPDSSYLVIGLTDPFGTDSKLHMIKMDIAGNEEWTKTVDSIDGEIVATMTEDQHLVYAAIENRYDTTMYGVRIVNSRLHVRKVDMDGNTIWTFTDDDPPTSLRDEILLIRDIKATPDGGVIIVGSQGNDAARFRYPLYLLRIDATGNLMWKKYNPNQTERQYERPSSIVLTPDGGFLMCVGASNAVQTVYDEWKTGLIKMDDRGNILWEKYFPAFTIGEDTLDFRAGGANINNIPQQGFHDLILTEDQRIIACGSGSLNFNGAWTNRFRLFLAEMDENGQLLQVKIPEMQNIFPVGNGRLIEMQQDQDGGFVFTLGELIEGGEFYLGTNPIISPRLARMTLLKTDAQLNTLWIKRFGSDYPLIEELHVGASVKRTSDDHYIIAGRHYFEPPNVSAVSDMYIVKTDTLPQNSFLIQGTVSREYLNTDCRRDPNMPGLQYNFIQTRGDITYSAITDTNGYYEMEILDTAGQYMVSVIPPNTLWNACEPSQDIQVNHLPDTLTVNFLINTEISCPYMSVDIGTPFLRQCIDSSKYTVQYCNMGTAVATNATIEVVLPTEMELVGTTGNLASQQLDTLTFDLGDVEIGECGNFNVQVFIPCETERELTHCVEARIFPDTNCLPLDPIWDFSSLSLTGACEGDTVVFRIQNIGQGNMSQPSHYIVIEDEIMLDQDQIQLLSGEMRTIKYPANGHTIRMELDQVAGHPGQSEPIAAIEGCGTGPFNWNNIMRFRQNDGDPTVDITCDRVRAAYDPNDKQGFPLGVGEEHYIEPNTELEYLIRFQNVGNDTAFTVVIHDTLSSHLDILSIAAGASSHPYQLGFAGENVLKFTFSNIHLPDSTTDEAASHGFVKFRIKQREDLPLGTIIYNSAAIFFDYLDPIITNQTYHEVNENFLTATIDPAFAEQRIEIKAFPNPFSRQTTFRLERTQHLKRLHFECYDVQGRLLQRRDISGLDQFELSREGLASGLYFYRITTEGQLLGSGKLLVH